MQSILGRSLPSPARTRSAARLPLTVGLVQIRWRDTPAEHREVLRDGVLTARDAGAQVVFLPELTLSRYPADARPDGTPMERAEALPGGPTHELAADLAAEAGIPVHASLYERADMGDGLGYNTAILVAPGGELLGATRKLHIPRTAGYHEDHYFRPGPAEPNPYPVIDLAADRPEPVRLAFRPAGRVVPRGGPCLRPGRRRRPRLPDGHRLRAQPSGFRHRAAVAPSHRGQRNRERPVHGGAQPLG